METAKGKKIIKIYDKDEIKSFTIRKVISESFSSKNLLAIEKETNQKFVFKVLYFSEENDEDDYEHGNLYKFKNLIFEAEVITNLISPLIVQISGICVDFEYEEKHTATIILEYCSNGTISDFLSKSEKSSKLDSTKKLICIYGIAAGMSYIHSNNIIHFNLTPKSIFLDDKLYPKIGCFHTSKIILDNDDDTSDKEGPDNTRLNDDDLLDKEIEQTLIYVAPEVLETEKITKASDVYSFGVTVHEILTGEKPFEKRSDKIKLSDEIPACFRDLISRCLSNDPQERPTFSEIISKLRSEKSFITESVDEEEFLSFLEFVDLAHPEQKLHVEVKPIDLSLFKQGELIGKGAFAKVFKIEEIKTANFYAAKINNVELKYDNPVHIESISQEINILSKLNSHSILKFIGYNMNDFENSPRPTIITELVQKGSLDKIIESERKGLSAPNWDDTKKLINIYGIAFGMSYLHSQNIVHRDLKPANIFVDDSLYPKIGDFGFSKEIEGELTENQYFGSPCYFSPEYIKTGLNHKPNDVYAFSLIVYELLTLEIPCKDFDYFQILKEVQAGYRPKIESNVPKCYRELIEQCWSQDPSERPTFEDIIDRLKSNREFVSGTVDEDEFLSYTDYLSEYDLSHNFPNAYSEEADESEQSTKSFDLYDDGIPEKTKIGSTDKKEDENKAKIESIDKKEDENKAKIESIDKKEDETKAKIESIDKKEDENKAKIESIDKKEDENKAKIESIDKKEDENKAKIESIDKKEDENKTKIESIDKKEDENKAKIESIDKKEDENKAKIEEEKKVSENYDRVIEPIIEEEEEEIENEDLIQNNHIQSNLANQGEENDKSYSIDEEQKKNLEEEEENQSHVQESKHSPRPSKTKNTKRTKRTPKKRKCHKSSPRNKDVFKIIIKTEESDSSNSEKEPESQNQPLSSEQDCRLILPKIKQQQSDQAKEKIQENRQIPLKKYEQENQPVSPKSAAKALAPANTKDMKTQTQTQITEVTKSPRKKQYFSNYDPSIFYSNSTSPTWPVKPVRGKVSSPIKLKVTLKDIGLEGLDSPTTNEPADNSKPASLLSSTKKAQKSQKVIPKASPRGSK